VIPASYGSDHTPLGRNYGRRGIVSFCKAFIELDPHSHAAVKQQKLQIIRRLMVESGGKYPAVIGSYLMHCRDETDMRVSLAALRRNHNSLSHARKRK
jgi:hypothetical protein